MRFKKLIAMTLCLIVIALSVFPVWAEGEISAITSAYMLEGSLYYCNSATGQVVLKNVKPLSGDAEAKALAEALEYTETRLFGENIYLKDGTQAWYDWLNNYADDTVRVIAVKQADGRISVLYLRFV